MYIYFIICNAVLCCIVPIEKQLFYDNFPERMQCINLRAIVSFCLPVTILLMWLPYRQLC